MSDGFVFTLDAMYSEVAGSICWVCSNCFEMVVSDDPTPAPAKCMFCGGTAFKKAE
jgi:hypothetical protein